MLRDRFLLNAVSVLLPPLPIFFSPVTLISGMQHGEWEVDVTYQRVWKCYLYIIPAPLTFPVGEDKRP